MANKSRKKCPMRHENGNCLPAGGFCTAVNDSICESLHNAFRHGESAEYERLTLKLASINAKYQQKNLEVLKKIHEKVTTDTTEVAHGRWKEGDLIHKYGCSCCWVRQDRISPYCPNCGAKMDGDGNG